MSKTTYVFNSIYDWIVDTYLNVKTTKCLKSEEHDNIINFMYEPVPYRNLNRTFDKYPVQEGDHLIDIGCGKGRVLVAAAIHGCKNLYGVDINESLLAFAERNITRLKIKHKDIKLELLCMNAKNYYFDPKINKVFFYNPFQLKVFIYIFKALIRSLDENPRPVTVYFCGAQQSTINYFEKLNKFKLIGQEENGVYIYSCSYDLK